MNRYTNSFDDVTTRATSAREAADIIARRIYGKRGFCRSMRHDSRTEDNHSHTYEVFIGVPVRGEPGTTSGRNIWLFEKRLDR